MHRVDPVCWLAGCRPCGRGLCEARAASTIASRGASAFAKSNKTIGVRSSTHAGGVNVHVLALAHLVLVVDVAAAGPGGSTANAARGRGGTDGAALARHDGIALLVEIAACAWWGCCGARGEVGQRSELAGGGDSLEAGEARDAIGAFSIECGG